MDRRLARLLTLGAVLSMTVSGVAAFNAAPLAVATGDTQPSGCPALQTPVDKTLPPLVIITESPVPGPKKLRQQPTPEEATCAERLRKAGKKAIEKKKLVEGIWRYLAAVKVAPAQSEVIYQELANALDRGAYVQPALAAYFKAWKAIEIDYDRPDAKLDSIAVLSLAEIRDSIVRLGGRVPVPISAVGRTVIADSTRHLREQYFNTDPLLLPNTPEPSSPP